MSDLTDRLARAFFGTADILQTRSADPNLNGNVMPASIRPPERMPGVRDVNPKQALSLAAVYAAVSIITTIYMQMDLIYFDQNGKPIRPGEQGYPTLLLKPDMYLTKQRFIEHTIGSLSLHGNGYVKKTRNAKGTVINATPLNPLKVVPTGDDMGNPVSFRYNGKTFTPDEIEHLKLFSYPGEVLGYGPIQAQRGNLRAALDVSEYANNWFENAGVPTGTLTTEQQLDGEQAAEYKKRWNETAGSMNGVAILGAGLSYESIFLTPEEAQWISVQSFNNSQVAAMFGVDSGLLETAVSGQSITYQNLQDVGLKMLTYRLFRYAQEIEPMLSSFFPGRARVEFDPDTLLRSNAAQRAANAGAWIQAGVRVPSEYRAAEGLAAYTEEQLAEQLRFFGLKTSAKPAATDTSNAA